MNFKENLGSRDYYDHAPDLAITNTLVHNFLGVRVNDVLTSWVQPGKIDNKCPTLIMIAKVDWNNDGFADGSRTFVTDWKL